MSETSLIGGLAGLDSGNDDSLEKVYYSKQYRNLLNNYSRFFNPRDLTRAADEYGSAFRANDGLAKENAAYYADKAKQIFEDPSSYMGDYERLRSGNLDALKGVYQNVLDYGLAGIKGRLAAGGYGNQGPSSYDRILNSQMTTSNIAPVLNTIFGNLGRDAGYSHGSHQQDNANKLALMANDFLTRYADNNAARTLVPYQTRMGLVDRNVGSISNAINAIRNNIAGFELKKGLASRLNDSAEGVQNFAKFFMSMYGGGMGGGMGGMGGGGGGGQQQPQQPALIQPQGTSSGGGNMSQLIQLLMQAFGRNGTPMINQSTPTNYGVDTPYTGGGVDDYFNATALA